MGNSITHMPHECAHRDVQFPFQIGAITLSLRCRVRFLLCCVMIVRQELKRFRSRFVFVFDHDKFSVASALEPLFPKCRRKKKQTGKPDIILRRNVSQHVKIWYDIIVGLNGFYAAPHSLLFKDFIFLSIHISHFFLCAECSDAAQKPFRGNIINLNARRGREFKFIFSFSNRFHIFFLWNWWDSARFSFCCRLNLSAVNVEAEFFAQSKLVVEWNVNELQRLLWLIWIHQ